MPPAPATNLPGRVLDVIFGKKLEGEDAERALAERPPKWACTVYGALLWASFLVAFALLAWDWGWIPFVDSRIDTIWTAVALGANALLRLVWEQVTHRYERRAKAGCALKATFPE